MADYSNSKPAQGAVFPENVIESPWGFLEPLLTPDQLKSRFLFGIPLVSNIADPLTNKRQSITNEILEDYIKRAIAKAEMESHIDILPRQRDEKHAFDRAEWDAFGYFKLRHRPVASVEKVTITPSTGVDVFSVPLSWIDPGYMIHGQISIIPIIPSVTSQSVLGLSNSTTQSSPFLLFMGTRNWISGYWNVRYTSGFPNSMLPTMMNELVGIVAAQDILSSLSATYGLTISSSISIDAMSQSISTPGGQVFLQRFKDLQHQRDVLLSKFRAMYKQKIFSGNV